MYFLLLAFKLKILIFELNNFYNSQLNDDISRDVISSISQQFILHIKKPT